MTQFAGVEQLHRPSRRLVAEGEQPVIETGADDRNIIPIHRIQSGQLFCLVFAQRQDTVYPSAVSQHPVTELRALDKLPQLGRVAGSDHREVRQDTSRDCAYQPEMMAMDDINGKRLDQFTNYPCKYLFILKYRFRWQIAETGTGIGHNIAHPWYGKIEIASGEADETTALCIDSLKLRDQSGRNPRDKEIAMTASSRLAQQILQINATTGALGMLADDMEDIHGQLQICQAEVFHIGRKDNQYDTYSLLYLMNPPIIYKLEYPIFYNYLIRSRDTILPHRLSTFSNCGIQDSSHNYAPDDRRNFI